MRYSWKLIGGKLIIAFNVDIEYTMNKSFRDFELKYNL